MNRKRTRRKTHRGTRRKTKQNIRKNNTKSYNKNRQLVKEKKRKSVGGCTILRAAKNTLLASKSGVVKVNIPKEIWMSCCRCGDWNNFYIYTIHAYGKFLYCGKCMAVQGFAARV